MFRATVAETTASRFLNPKATHLRAFLFAIGLLAIAQEVSMAHEDPRGEVHPRIEIRNETFIVSAGDNTYQEVGKVRGIFRSVDRKGRVLNTRTEILPEPPFKPYEQYSFISQLSEDENGLERKFRDGWLIIPEWSRKHGGKPYLIEKQGDDFSYHPLRWKFSGVEGVIDAIIDNDDLYLLITRYTGKTELWLHRFSLLTFEEKGGVKLPDPSVIYSPVCSNLIIHGKTVYVAIVRERFWGHNLVLTGWDGFSAKTIDKSLTNHIDWNTSVVLSHIQDDAVVAYHYGFDFFFYERAKIQIIHTKLKGR